MLEKGFKILSKEVESEILISRLNNWKLQADEFFRASEIIFKQINSDHEKILENAKKSKESNEDFLSQYQPDLSSTYFLLIGFCLENMIKGIVLHNNPSYLSNGKLNNIVKTHNLARIYNQLLITATMEEKELFDFLTLHIEWRSKYPIPTKAKDLIGGTSYQISSVRIKFLKVHEKLNELMINTKSLGEHLHNYKFKG